MNGLNWYWIGLEASVVPILGVLFALPLWLKEQPVFGNIAGTVVIFGSAFALIMREHMQIEAMVGTCLEGGIPCFPHPDAFTRFAVYAFVALFEVILLFTVSLRVEHKLRRRGYDPQWR